MAYISKSVPSTDFAPAQQRELLGSRDRETRSPASSGPGRERRTSCWSAIAAIEALAEEESTATTPGSHDAKNRQLAQSRHSFEAVPGTPFGPAHGSG
jgi:hypothetical protein